MTISLISCTNLKITGKEAQTENNEVDDVRLYASFIADNEGIPLTIDGLAGNTHVVSKPLMRTHAVDSTAMWGNDLRAYTAAEFSHNVPKKKALSNDIVVLLGLMKGEESFPLAVTTLQIDPSQRDSILSLPVRNIPAEPPAKKKKKLFSLKKRKTKEEPEHDEPMLLDRFDLQSSAHGAKLNIRVQIKGKDEPNDIEMIEEVRHDFVTKAKVDSYEDMREESSIPNDVVEQVEEEENSVDGIVEYVPSEVEASSYYTKRPSTIMENVLQGLSCGGILTCQGDEDESQSEVEQEEESRGKSTAETVVETVAETVDQTIAETVDQNVESDLKMAVETVRCELDVRTQQSKQSSISYENESEDGTPSAGAPTVGASTVGSFTVETKTVDIDDFVALPTAEEDTAEESTVPSRKDSRSPTFIYEEDVSVFEKGRKQERQQYESSCDDSFTAFDNLTAYTEDVTTAFGTRFDESTFMGGNVFM